MTQNQAHTRHTGEGRRRAVAAVVADIAAEMRRARLWETDAPSPRRLASSQPFCFDTLQFHQWLQWQFLPRMTEILDGGHDLPDSSAILPYAEEFLPSRLEDPRRLLFLLRTFDELITRDWPKAGMHDCQ
jgi:uncharacterized protein YqcC (DUF446 family)